MKPIRIAQPPITLSNQFKQPISKKTTNQSFADVLAKTEQLKVSKHASDRMMQRQIKISDAEWQKIDEKLILAKQKGLNDSLFLTENAALIVNVKNSTVVTVMNRQEASEQIFTNINGAIII